MIFSGNRFTHFGIMLKAPASRMSLRTIGERATAQPVRRTVKRRDETDVTPALLRAN